MENRRINRSEIFQDVSDKTGFSIGDIRQIYNAMVDSVVLEALRGNTVVMNGFGIFYVQKHKGHPIQFRSGKHDRDMNDYLVFKFSAAHSMNERLRNIGEQCEAADYDE